MHARTARRRRARHADFAPTLLDGVPEDAFAYVSVRGLRSLAPCCPPRWTLAPLLEQLDGEIALSIAPERRATRSSP